MVLIGAVSLGAAPSPTSSGQEAPSSRGPDVALVVGRRKQTEGKIQLDFLANRLAGRAFGLSIEPMDQYVDAILDEPSDTAREGADRETREAVLRKAIEIGQILTRTDAAPGPPSSDAPTDATDSSSSPAEPVGLDKITVDALTYLGALAIEAFAERLKQHVHAEAERFADWTWDRLGQSRKQVWAMLRRQLQRRRTGPLEVETSRPDTAQVAAAIDKSAAAVLEAAATLPTMSPLALARTRRAMVWRLTWSGAPMRAARGAVDAAENLVAHVAPLA